MFTLAESIKHIFATALLAVVRIQGLEPSLGLTRIRREPVLGDDAFAVTLADGSEEIHASALDVVGVKEAFVSAGTNQAPQSALPFGQWQSAEIFAVEPQQIEGVKRCVVTPSSQPELRQRRSQLPEAPILILLSGDQSAGSVFDVGDAAPAIHFEFVHEIVTVK